MEDNRIEKEELESVSVKLAQVNEILNKVLEDKGKKYNPPKARTN